MKNTLTLLLILLFLFLHGFSFGQQQCGPGLGSCNENSPCCNKDGTCGSSLSDCGYGCQSDYGVCDVGIIRDFIESDNSNINVDGVKMIKGSLYIYGYATEPFSIGGHYTNFYSQSSGQFMYIIKVDSLLNVEWINYCHNPLSPFLMVNVLEYGDYINIVYNRESNDDQFTCYSTIVNARRYNITSGNAGLIKGLNSETGFIDDNSKMIRLNNHLKFAIQSGDSLHLLGSFERTDFVEFGQAYPTQGNRESTSGGPGTRDTFFFTLNLDTNSATPRFFDSISWGPHPWFADINWKNIESRKSPGPLIPTLRSAGDTTNFGFHDNYHVASIPNQLDIIIPPDIERAFEAF